MKTMVHKLLMVIALAAAVQWPASAVAASSAAAPATVAIDNCSWDRPGVNPFMGDVVAAVDRYRDIPPEVRERLKARMAKREYDDLVSIRRDSIQGRGGYDYGNTISEMHFGTHQVCRSVTRTAWSPTMEERGLVYCESGTCILVPTVCRNVSRILRKGVGNELAEGPLLFDPPGAGPQAPVAANDAPPIDGLPPTGAGLPGAGPLGASPTGIGSVGEGAGAPAFGNPGFAGGSGAPGGFGVGVPGSPGVFPVPLPTTGASGTPPGGSDTPVAPPTAPIPEPQTWALMLVGLATITGIARRRSAPR